MLETRLTPAFEFKLARSEPAGTFRGYASTFGGPPDSFGDVIAPGAFTESLKARTPALLWGHDPQEPIGKWQSIAEDRYGLSVEGKLTLATKRGSEAHALMRDGALGLSIGFRVKSGGAAYEGNQRVLKALDLVEISAVSMPANVAARVTSVKSFAAFQRPENIREFEAALRDACGFSVREAKRIASAGWPALMRRDDAGEQIAALLIRAANEFQQPQH